MPTAPLLSDDLLEPIADGQPAGTDLRWTPEWDRIKEARRADDELESGKWAKKQRKTADWRTVRELTAAALRQRSKDLQLALWLTEANMKSFGFPGLRDGLRITCELMVRYWDQGLYPSMEDGPEDRVGPFEWLNNKLTDSITALPITTRGDGGRDYSFNDFMDARRLPADAAAEGRVSMDMIEAAIRATSRAAYEGFSADFQQTMEAFQALEKMVDERFGDAAPNLSGCRNALHDIHKEVEKILEKKRVAEPDAVVGGVARDAAPADSEGPGDGPRPADRGEKTNPMTVRIPLSLVELPAVAGGWDEAEALLRSGQVDKGLARMVQLSTKESTGRSRFQRRLLLAEACLASQRQRLARPILEELAEQIEKFQLEAWESPELIASVWVRLYKLYKQDGDSADPERAEKLYQRLCRLDPWQALGCTDV